MNNQSGYVSIPTTAPQDLLNAAEAIENVTTLIETDWDSAEQECTIKGLDELEELITTIEKILNSQNNISSDERLKAGLEKLRLSLTHLANVLTDIVEFERITREVREARKHSPTTEEQHTIEQILKKAQTTME